MSDNDDYLDGNAAAGALAMIFVAELTTAQGQCGSCGATKPFAEARVYVNAPGFVARCSACENVLLRFTTTGERTFLDVRGLAYLAFAV